MAKRGRKGSSVRTWFVEQYNAHPEWITERSNEPILELYKSTFNKTEIPSALRANLASLKSKMRSELRGGKPASKKPKGASVTAASKANDIDKLELMIDDSITFARALNVDKLFDVIRHLRRARAGILMAFDQ